MERGRCVIAILNAGWWSALCTPSSFLGGGEKVAEGRMRGDASYADARNPSPRPSPLIR